MTLPESIIPSPFEPTLESLREFKCPEWFRDAKLGIWSHWGPQSVPKFGDWYARHMYEEGSLQYLYHRRVYGHPSKFGYKDIINLWKAEKFDPDGLMDLYVKAGAKYFTGQAMHHDNFDNFDSKYNRFNSVNMGPKKDITKLWQDAAVKRGLHFGLTEHLGASYEWYKTNKGCDTKGSMAGVPYDGNDPEFAELYYKHDNKTGNGWYTQNEEFHKHWFLRIKDVIDKYQPDLLYSDGGLPFGEYGKAIVAHLYNTSVQKYGSNQAVYNQKDTNPEVYKIGILDIERGMQEEIPEDPWQDDTTLADWFYDVKYAYKSPSHVIETLLNTVSKNGNLLMNVPQLPDGTLDDECLYILKELADWMSVNAEGIHGTRAWLKYGEGETNNKGGGAFNEKDLEWTAKDFRFTKKGHVLYAFEMRMPEDGKALIRSVAQEDISEVKLLGVGNVPYNMTSEGLLISLPEKFNSKYPFCFAVTLK